ncbi:MAG: valine--tRNA ligase, partial [Saprospiraceae bacterium]|nr:valine--tRNA ligase [Bacteroidia bacterium]NNL90822.1 valine--tRNA ligase [Saprospiraceae bacterium]
NVTGVLHMEHMLNNTIQDVLIRKARLDGKNACWVPGTDHASIATEAKVVHKLREQGIKKSDLSREDFLKHAWDWTDQYGGIILKQLRKLGASPDWDRTSFTMDDTRYKAVIKAFVDLYNSGKLYRGNRMVNWDPVAKTVLSNEEVLRKEESGKLYHVKYQIEGEDAFITIATTRPETILGDSAIAVHPDDERFAQLKGKKAIVPIVNRSVPIIFDSYVDQEFGTGALKVTPAHDQNDYDLGNKHNLEVIDILNDDGSISEAGQFYIGEDRFKARKLMIKDLEELELIVKIEDLVHNVGRSERTNAVVEPKLSLQWYVDMKKLAQPAIDAVENGDIKFYPEKYVNTYRHWMENIRDWCISRQLWWGQRIPAYYYNDKIFVAETKEEALVQAKKEFPNLSIEELKQEEDVLDTWFSSWLWPISVFDGFNSKEEIDYYYPTSVLVTGWDIIFLWVARMIIAGYEWKGQLPFKDVYFTGMVRDTKRRKMSKSLGNSPDALKLIEDYGADGVRFGMLSCSPAGGDLLFDNKLVENGRNFSNKLWNALRLIKGWDVDSNLEIPKGNALAYNWITNEFDKLLISLDKAYKTYRISEGLMSLYSFIWNDFFSWYLEMIKPEYGKPIDSQSLENAIELYEKVCLVLHPFMPFITEEVYHTLRKREENDNCINGKYPKSDKKVDNQIITDIDHLKNIVSNIRDIKNKKQIKPKELIDISVIKNDEIEKILKREGFIDQMKKLAFVDNVIIEDNESGIEGLAFISGKTKFFAHLALEIDNEKECAKAQEELKYQEGFVNGVKKKLENERFVSNAPEQVVAKERKKLDDGLARIEALKKIISKLCD